MPILLVSAPIKTSEVEIHLKKKFFLKRGMGDIVYRPRKEINYSYHLLRPYYGTGTMQMGTYFLIYFPKNREVVESKNGKHNEL